MMRTLLILAVLLSADGPVFGQKDGTKVDFREPITYHVPDGMTTPASLRIEHPNQQGPYCGPNCLYIILRLKGVAANPSEVSSRVPTGPAGSSLANLKAASESFGLKAEVRKVVMDDLPRFRAPYIFHLTTPAEGGVRPTEARDYFVVVTSAQPDGAVAGVNPNSGHRAIWTPSYLSRNISGCVMIVGDPAAKLFSTSRLTLLVVFGGLTAYNIWLAVAAPPRSPSLPAPV